MFVLFLPSISYSAANSTSLKLEKEIGKFDAWWTGYCDITIQMASVNDFVITKAYSSAIQQLREYYVNNGLFESFLEGEKHAKQKESFNPRQALGCQISTIRKSEKLEESNSETKQ